MAEIRKCRRLAFRRFRGNGVQGIFGEFNSQSGLSRQHREMFTVSNVYSLQYGIILGDASAMLS